MRTGKLALASVAVATSIVILAAQTAARAVSGLAPPAGRASGVCHAPRLAHLRLRIARERATRAGCTLTVNGATLHDAAVQTVQRQSRAHGTLITVWINPFCAGSADSAPKGEPPKAGPTEIVSGFYLVGGPLRRFSAPGCHRQEQKPLGGSVQVLDAATGAVVARGSATAGHLVRVPLTPGSYNVVGTFEDATINGIHPSRTIAVQIPAGRIVRQNFTLNIP